MRWLAALLLCALSTTAGAESWRVVLIGDTPYGEQERRALPAMLQAINDENVDLIVHAGDFKHSNDTCSDALFEDRRRLFDASDAPFVYVPGDNEWTDCERLAAGHYAPLERLAALRRVFMPTDESLGQRRIPLQRQAGDYREHQRWRLGPVVFATLNVPGGNNNYRPDGQPGPEASARMPQVLGWLRDTFAVARAEKLAGVVLVMQADPAFKRFASGVGHRAFRSLLETLREETMNFSGQVLLVHGDTHWQRVDKPLRNPANGKRLANFTRAETFGYPFMGWVKVFIEPDRPALFRFEAHPWPQPGN